MTVLAAGKFLLPVASIIYGLFLFCCQKLSRTNQANYSGDLHLLAELVMMPAELLVLIRYD